MVRGSSELNLLSSRWGRGWNPSWGVALYWADLVLGPWGRKYATLYWAPLPACLLVLSADRVVLFSRVAVGYYNWVGIRLWLKPPDKQGSWKQPLRCSVCSRGKLTLITRFASTIGSGLRWAIIGGGVGYSVVVGPIYTS